MLAIMAKRVGFWAGGCLGLQQPGGMDLGEIFSYWVSLDAFVVLSGAVLTAYVGISGLIARMAKDRCLPQIMLRKVGSRDEVGTLSVGCVGDGGVSAAGKKCVRAACTCTRKSFPNAITPLRATHDVDATWFRLCCCACIQWRWRWQNKWRGTHHNIIFGFFLLATSQVLILQVREERQPAYFTVAQSTHN